MSIPQETINALKPRMPEYLERVHGLTDVRKQFPVPWREDANPSCKYAPKTFTVIDTSRNVAKNVFQLCGCDFNIDRFPDQVRKVAEILGEQVSESKYSTSGYVKKTRKPKLEPPKNTGFENDVSEQCINAAKNLLLGESESCKMARAWLNRRGFVQPEKWVSYGLGFMSNWKAKQIHPSLRTGESKGNVAGFVTIPYFDAKHAIHYCVLRTVVPEWATEQEPNRKEWCPTGIGRPLYNEHYLSIGLDAVAVTEGPIDAISLSIMTGVPAIGLGSTSLAGRFCSVLYYTKPDKRPKKVIVNMDGKRADGEIDQAGAKAAEKISSFLDELRIPHAAYPMPDGVKDANELLQMQVRGEL